MKHGSFKAIRIAACFFMAFVAVFSSFGDELFNQLESKILENFNGDSDYTWKVTASKFATKSDDVEYPQMAYVSAWPVALFGYNRNGDDIKSLGIHGRFDRRGYNWIDLYPVKGGDGDDKDDPVEMPVPGRARNFDMWVWGSNLNFYIEMFLRDHDGVVHVIKLGDIAFTGWKNLRVNVPNHISQSKRVLPSYAGLKFVKFRIWTQPIERVGNFYVYFKQFKVLTDVYESLFDGNDLANQDYVNELWDNAAN